MIKETDRIDEYEIYEITCDSCHVIIGECQKFEYKEGQELKHSPILCETCGRIHNKFVGDTVQENEKLKQELKKYLKENLK